jgi:hypothetical protein
MTSGQDINILHLRWESFQLPSVVQISKLDKYHYLKLRCRLERDMRQKSLSMYHVMGVYAARAHRRGLRDAPRRQVITSIHFASPHHIITPKTTSH